MAKIKKLNNETGFPDKYYKVLMGSNVMEELDAANEETLKKTIVECETSIEEQQQLKDNDAKLQEIKEQMKALGGGYRDAQKFQNAKIKYALYCLEKQGKI